MIDSINLFFQAVAWSFATIVVIAAASVGVALVLSSLFKFLDDEATK